MILKSLKFHYIGPAVAFLVAAVLVGWGCDKGATETAGSGARDVWLAKGDVFGGVVADRCTITNSWVYDLNISCFLMRATETDWRRLKSQLLEMCSARRTKWKIRGQKYEGIYALSVRGPDWWKIDENDKPDLLFLDQYADERRQTLVGSMRLFFLPHKGRLLADRFVG